MTVVAPETAQDATLVPVTLKVSSTLHLKELDLVIDENPSPVAARIHFGAAGDDRQMKLRVRVNAFTNMHVVGVLGDGKLLQDVAYVQGAGGCSAPMGSMGDATANIGEMRMKFASTDAFPGARVATLMIRHPNFNGMQMNDATQKIIPARYIKSIKVTRGDATVFDFATDISLSTNPVIEFLYRRSVQTGEPFVATVVDTNDQVWTQQIRGARARLTV